MTELAPEQHIRLEVVKLYAQTYEFLPLKELREYLYEISSWIITGETVEPNAPQEPAEGDAGTAEGADSPETQDAHEAETSGEMGTMLTEPPEGEGWVAWTPGLAPGNLDGIEAVWFGYHRHSDLRHAAPKFWAQCCWMCDHWKAEFHITHIKLKDGYQLVDGQVVPTWEWDPKNPTMPPWSRVWTGGKQPVANDVRVVALMRDGEIFYDHDANTWLVSWENSITEWATLDPADMPEEREV